MKTWYFIILIISIFLITCKKKDDNTLPQVTLTAPIENLSIMSVDTVEVVGVVTDDKKITGISITIVNESMVPITGTTGFNPNSKESSINFELVLNKPDLESGTYYLLVSASDEEGTQKDYTRLNITGIDKELQEIFIAVNSSGNTGVCRLGTDTIIQEFVFNEGFNDLCTNPHSQQIQVLGDNGTLSSYNYTDYTEVWQETNLNNYQTPYFGKLRSFDNLIFASYTNGSIFGFNASGDVSSPLNISDNTYKPSIFYDHTNYVIIKEIPQGIAPKRVELIYKGSGLSMQYHSVTYDIVDFTSFDNDRIIIWGNEAGEMKVCTLNIGLQHVDEISDGFPAEEVISAVQTEDHIHLFKTASGIYRYNTSTYTVSDFLTGISGTVMKFEELSNRIYIIDNNKVKVYSYTTGDLITTYTHSSTIFDLEFFYNK